MKIDNVEEITLTTSEGSRFSPCLGGMKDGIIDTSESEVKITILYHRGSGGVTYSRDTTYTFQKEDVKSMCIVFK